MDNDNITLSRQGIINRIFCVLMVLLLSSVEVWADTVNYMQYNVGSDSFSSVTANATAISNSITELGTDGNTTYYYVNGDITCTSRITVNGNVHLILVDGKSLTANDGIYVPHGSSLTIYGQSGNTGTLTATGSTEGHSGIGGNENQHESASGDITINGGTINATGYNGGAGIGTGHNGDGSGLTITINGGIITATGGACSGNGAGAGIGSGYQRNNGTIIIRGGKITANGATASGQWSAGIGAGSYDYHGGNAGNITITGGQITATGGGNNSGIGYGWNGSSGNISLSCSRVDDYIQSTGYTGTTSVADGKELLVFNGTTLEKVVSGSNPSDIGGKTLRMANYCGASGENAKNVVWYLTNDILHIEKNPTSSTGAMANYTSSTERPWFSYSEEISTLIIGDGVATIGNNAFSYFSNLTSVTIGSGVTSIGNYAFDHSFSSTVPTSITIPTSVTTIGQYAFRYCNLTSVSIPGNSSATTSIDHGAFEFCNPLKTVVIGSGVSSIGNYAFYNCELLESVISYRTTPPTIGTTNVFDGNADGRKIYVPYESVDTYKSAWSSYAGSIETSPEYVPLTLEAIAAGTITFKNRAANAIHYKINGGAEQDIPYTSFYHNGTAIEVSAGDIVTFYGINSKYVIDRTEYSFISCTADCYVYGNIMSLIDKTNFATNTTLTETYALAYLFKDNTKIKNHPSKKLVLPATELTVRCYDHLFYGCTGLTSAPELPATTLKHYCYDYMFYGCTGLTSAPALPATTMTYYCYHYMFYGCTGLTSAPELPATTLAKYCYDHMFYGCTGLTSAPELPATELVSSCYGSMFYGCTGLTSAPELPATTLASSCYEYMFQGCTNLNKVICLANIYNASYTENWLDGVAPSGTFVKANGMNSWETGVSGIPSGWTVAEGISNWTDLKSAMSVDNNIVLLGNCTDLAPSSTSYLDVPANKTVVLDLNGYTIDRGLATSSAVSDGYVIKNQGTLTIQDGSTGKTGVITGGNNNNNGENTKGGGIHNKGSLAINGGSIKNNSASQGGGIYNSGNLTITGGTITNNNTNSDGGGIYHGGNNFYLSGNPTISSNTKNGSAANNVYMKNVPIQITGTLSNTTPIGISLSDSGVFTSGLSGKGNASNFASDDDSYVIGLTSANEAWCGSSSISSVAITGIDAPATLTAFDTSAACATMGVASVAVAWKNGTTAATGNANAEIAYTAEITLTPSTNFVFPASPTAKVNGETATSVSKNGDNLVVTYTFPATVKLDPTITTDPTASAITYGQTLANSTLSDGVGSVAGTFAWTDKTIAPSVSDSQTTEYGVTFTPADATNYNTATTKLKLTVNPKVVTSPTITLGETSFTYDGTEKKPTVTVKDGERTIPATEYTVSYENNTNVGTATVKITDKDGGNYNVSGSATFAIAAADGSLVPPTGKTGLVYTGSPMDLITAGSSTTGTVQYSLDGSTYNTTIPEGKEAKEYTIYYKVVANPGYTDVAAQNFKVTIAPKTVTSPTITLSESSYTYDGTAKKPDVTSVKDGETTIPATEYTVSYEDNINVGTATVKIADKDGGNYNVSGSASFKIEAPEEPAPTTTKQTVEVTTADGEVVKVNIEATVTDETKKEVVITKIDIPASEAGSTEVAIPATIDIGGVTYTVTSIGDQAFAGKTDITDIYLPNTEKPITIGKDALKISETQIARVHAPLPLLDDYSFDKELEPNLDAGKLMTTVTPQNQYWTFSCGIDVDVPEGVKVYKCMLNDEGTAVIITQISEADLGGIIKAHNGVLLSSTAGHPYDIIASHNADITSIADRDDKSYGRDNLLEPVILRKNYPADEYYVLYNNEFRAILDNSSTVPECRAVLHKPAGVSASRSLDIDEDETTAIRLFYALPDDDGDWYNMNGQRIERPTQKGVYIQKGKKIIIK